MNFTVVASFSIIPNKVEPFKAALAEVARDTKAEPGCLQYAVYTSSDKANDFFILEKFVSRSDYLAHTESAHIARFREIAGPMFSEPPRILRSEEPW